MGKQDRTRVFSEVPVSKAVISLAVPTVIASIVSILYSLADTWFVGLLNSPVQTAAVTLAAPVTLAFFGVTNLFGVGSSSMMGRALGRGDKETVQQSSVFGFYGAACCAVLYALACTVFRTPLLSMLGVDSETILPTDAYLTWTVSLGALPSILNIVMAFLVRTEGASLHASIGSMSGCVLNMILDPLFILPGFLNLGAEGAAIATFISNTAAVCYFFIYLVIHRKTTIICIDPRKLSLRREIVGGVCGVGVPASIQNILNVIGTVLFNNLAAPYGAAALAAMGICSKINMIPMNMIFGMSQGVQPLVSYCWGAKLYDRMKKSIMFTIRIALILGGSATLLFLMIPGQMVSLFIADNATVAHGTRLLQGYCLGIPLMALDFTAVGVFQAVGKGKNSLFFAILRKLICEIPFMHILNALFGLYGLGYSQAGGELVCAIAAGIVLLRLFRSVSGGKVPQEAKS